VLLTLFLRCWRKVVDMRNSCFGIGIGALVGLTATVGSCAVGTISGPFVHRNLQIFLIHGESQLEGRHYATLSEAIARGMVVVKETGNVSELSIENRSKEAIVFLNAGDIVKGGRQDRTIRDDLILQTHSGQVPLPSFCVENGRWTKRAGEDAANFSSNTKVLTSKSLKLAARYGQDQSQVWSGVAEQQMKLNQNLSRLSGETVDTRSGISSSSLQLTLENKNLDKIKKDYLDEFEPLLNGKTDVIGFAYAINGELNSAEVYNNKNLFRALWPKLLDAAVTEAVAECDNDRKYQNIAAGELKSFFETALSGSAREHTVAKSTLVRTITTPTTFLFETVDLQADGVWIHKSFINKGKEKVTVPLDRNSIRYTPEQQRTYPNSNK
jgi:hypothetical protein